MFAVKINPSKPDNFLYALHVQSLIPSKNFKTLLIVLALFGKC